jgi:hypothetical protein
MGNLKKKSTLNNKMDFSCERTHTDYVCKLKKALYGLKEASATWYSRMDKYLQHAGFRKGSAHNNLYIKVTKDSILLIEVYVDDIIFGVNGDRLS